MFAWHDTPWMWVSMLVFWALFIAFAYYALKGFTRSGPARSGGDATAILEQRYARGEISAEEYRDRRRTLETPEAAARQG